MPVEIKPASFSMVFFDATEIEAITSKLAAEIGLPADLAITVDVDETTPLGRAQLSSVDPAVLAIESGALEDPKRPRQLAPDGAADVIGRLLLELADRLSPGFADAPAEADLTLPQSVAWQVYCIGRLARLGYRTNRQRRLYQFRNRHGFTDAADAAFDRLWTASDLTWAELDQISADAQAAVSA